MPKPLLIDQVRSGGEKHVGTLDLDVGMTLVILDGHRYEELTARASRGERVVRKSGRSGEGTRAQPWSSRGQTCRKAP